MMATQLSSQKKIIRTTITKQFVIYKQRMATSNLSSQHLYLSSYFSVDCTLVVTSIFVSYLLIFLSCLAGLTPTIIFKHNISFTLHTLFIAKMEYLYSNILSISCTQVISRALLVFSFLGMCKAESKSFLFPCSYFFYCEALPY